MPQCAAARLVAADTQVHKQLVAQRALAQHVQLRQSEVDCRHRHAPAHAIRYTNVHTCAPKRRGSHAGMRGHVTPWLLRGVLRQECAALRWQPARPGGTMRYCGTTVLGEQVQMWAGRAQSRCRCGRGEPSPGADVVSGIAAQPVHTRAAMNRAPSDNLSPTACASEAVAGWVQRSWPSIV